jgi:hypothetical protein
VHPRRARRDEEGVTAPASVARRQGAAGRGAHGDHDLAPGVGGRRPRGPSAGPPATGGVTCTRSSHPPRPGSPGSTASPRCPGTPGEDPWPPDWLGWPQTGDESATVTGRVRRSAWMRWSTRTRPSRTTPEVGLMFRARGRAGARAGLRAVGGPGPRARRPGTGVTRPTPRTSPNRCSSRRGPAARGSGPTPGALPAWWWASHGTGSRDAFARRRREERDRQAVSPHLDRRDGEAFDGVAADRVVLLGRARPDRRAAAGHHGAGVRSTTSPTSRSRTAPASRWGRSRATSAGP